MTYKYKNVNISDLVSGTSENIAKYGSSTFAYTNFPGNSSDKAEYIRTLRKYEAQVDAINALSNDIYKPAGFFNYTYPFVYVTDWGGLTEFTGQIDASLIRVAKYKDFDVSGTSVSEAAFLPSGFPTKNVKFKAILIGPGGAGGGGSGGKNAPGQDNAGSGGGSGYAGKVVVTPVINYDSTKIYKFYPGTSGAGGGGGSASNNRPGGAGGTGGTGTNTIFIISGGSRLSQIPYSAAAGDPGKGGNQTNDAGSTGGDGGSKGGDGTKNSNAADGALGGASVFPPSESSWVTITGYGGSGKGGKGGTAYSADRGGKNGESGQPGVVRVIYYYDPEGILKNETTTK